MRSDGRSEVIFLGDRSIRGLGLASVEEHPYALAWGLMFLSAQGTPTGDVLEALPELAAAVPTLAAAWTGACQADGHILPPSGFDASLLAVGHTHTFTAAARRQAVTALVLGGLARRVGPPDQALRDRLLGARAVVTTRWDVGIDPVFHDHAGTTPAMVGARACRVDEAGRMAACPMLRAPRPPLLKLRGSFAWLACRGCEQLYVHPRGPIAQLPGLAETGCPCGGNLDTVLGAAGTSFAEPVLREVWERALDAFAAADRWTFLGVGTRMDPDVAGLLASAAVLRRERGLPPAGVTMGLERGSLGPNTEGSVVTG